MRVTIIAPDERIAPLYRVRLLARLLMRRYAEVEVLGFTSRQGPPPDNAPRDFAYREFPLAPGRGAEASFRALREAVRGDVVYAMKARPTSYGLALRHRAETGVPVVLDVDDAELAMIAPYSKYPLKNMAYALPRLADPNNYLATWALHRRLGEADGLTVVSSHFRRLCGGGTLAPQYVDTALYDPSRFDREALRAELGLGSERALVFAGVAHPGKGVGEVVEALALLGPEAPPWRLLLVGPETDYARELAALEPRVTLVGLRPPSETPRYLAVADAVALPQRRAAVAAGQMPIKLFEAMAMACPIVSTAMADIPAVLDGCGLVVPPGDRPALARALAALLDDPAGARALGRAARERVLARYSWEVGAREVGDVLEAAAASRRAARSRAA